MSNEYKDWLRDEIIDTKLQCEKYLSEATGYNCYISKPIREIRGFGISYSVDVMENTFYVDILLNTVDYIIFEGTTQDLIETSSEIRKCIREHEELFKKVTSAYRDKVLIK